MSWMRHPRGEQPNGPWRAGAVGGFPGTHDGLWPRGCPTLAFAGEGLCLFAWVKGTISEDRLTLGQFDVWLRTDYDSLQVRWPDRKLVGNENMDETRPALVTGPKGEVLLLYRADPRRRSLPRGCSPSGLDASARHSSAQMIRSVFPPHDWTYSRLVPARMSLWAEVIPR